MRVWAESASSRLTSPKSAIFGVPSAASRTLAGLMSRWTIPRAMRHGQGAGQGLDDPGRVLDRLGLAADPIRQAAAGEILEREVRQAVVPADLEDLDDVRVVDGGDRAGLGLEPGQVPGPGTGAGADHLEGDEAVEPGLMRLVDDPHAAGAEHPQDLVTRDPGQLAVLPACGGRRGREPLGDVGMIGDGRVAVGGCDRVGGRGDLARRRGRVEGWAGGGAGRIGREPARPGDGCRVGRPARGAIGLGRFEPRTVRERLRRSLGAAHRSVAPSALDAGEESIDSDRFSLACVRSNQSTRSLAAPRGGCEREDARRAGRFDAAMFALRDERGRRLPL